MCTLVKKQAPDFTADAVWPDSQIKPLTLSSFKGHYVILFFYPLDFTFVCPTELVAFSNRVPEFEKLECKLISVSVDSAYSHFAWRLTERRNGGLGDIAFPMVSDITKSITRSYGILADESIAFRGLFLIDRDGIVRHELVNDLPLGRSVDEAYRMLEALRFFEKHGEVCPANWHPGDKAVIPTREGIGLYLEEHESACRKK